MAEIFGEVYPYTGKVKVAKMDVSVGNCFKPSYQIAMLSLRITAYKQEGRG